MPLEIRGFHVPKLLGAELYRPHPGYIIEMAVEPVVVHDFDGVHTT